MEAGREDWWNRKWYWTVATDQLYEGPGRHWLVLYSSDWVKYGALFSHWPCSKMKKVYESGIVSTWCPTPYLSSLFSLCLYQIIKPWQWLMYCVLQSGKQPVLCFYFLIKSWAHSLLQKLGEIWLFHMRDFCQCRCFSSQWCDSFEKLMLHISPLIKI